MSYKSYFSLIFEDSTIGRRLNNLAIAFLSSVSRSQLWLFTNMNLMDITNLSVKQAIFTHAEGNELRIRLCSSSYFLSRRERPISYWFCNQEPINRSLYLLYYALESTFPEQIHLQNGSQGRFRTYTVQRPNQNRARQSVLFYVTFPHDLAPFLCWPWVRSDSSVECNSFRGKKCRSKNKATRERVD